MRRLLVVCLALLAGLWFVGGLTSAAPLRGCRGRPQRVLVACRGARHMSTPNFAAMFNDNYWNNTTPASSITDLISLSGRASPAGTTAIVAAVAGQYDGGAVQVSDTQGNHYVLVKQSVNRLGPLPFTLSAFVAFSPRALALTDKITVTSPDTQSLSINMAYIVGGDGVLTLDGDVGTNQGSGSVASVASPGALEAGDLVFGFTYAVAATYPAGGISPFYTAPFVGSLVTVPTFPTIAGATWDSSLDTFAGVQRGASSFILTGFPTPGGPITAAGTMPVSATWAAMLIALRGAPYPVEPESVIPSMLQSAYLRM